MRLSQRRMEDTMPEDTAPDEGAPDDATPEDTARAEGAAPAARPEDEGGKAPKLYAIFEDRGKQYRAEEGRFVQVDLKQVDPGAEVVFDRVLLVGGGEGALVGRPTVGGAAVVAVVEGEQKGKKVRGLKRRRHSRSKTRWGHRQKYTLVRVKEIVTGRLANDRDAPGQPPTKADES